MNHVLRRRALLGAAAAALAAPALAQGRFPSRPIRFLIPWPPGGALDPLHRQMFEVMHTRERGEYDKRMVARLNLSID